MLARCELQALARQSTDLALRRSVLHLIAQFENHGFFKIDFQNEETVNEFRGRRADAYGAPLG